MLTIGRNVLYALIMAFFLISCSDNKNQNQDQGMGDNQNNETNTDMGFNSAGNQQPVKAEMNQMFDDMKNMPNSGNFDADFAAMMIRHHRGAVEMSNRVVSEGKNEQVKQYAQQLIQKEEKEIQELQQFAGARGQQTGATGNQTGQSGTNDQAYNNNQFGQRPSGEQGNMPGVSQQGTREQQSQKQNDYSKNTDNTIQNDKNQTDYSRNTGLNQGDKTGNNQDPDATPSRENMTNNQDQASAHNKLIQKMDESIGRIEEINPTDDVDQTYIQLMKEHHQSGIEMGQAAIKDLKNSKLKNVVNKSIKETKQDMAKLEKINENK